MTFTRQCIRPFTKEGVLEFTQKEAVMIGFSFCLLRLEYALWLLELWKNITFPLN